MRSYPSLSLSPVTVQPHDFEMHSTGNEEESSREMNYVFLYQHFKNVAVLKILEYREKSTTEIISC